MESNAGCSVSRVSMSVATVVCVEYWHMLWWVTPYTASTVLLWPYLLVKSVCARLLVEGCKASVCLVKIVSTQSSVLVCTPYNLQPHACHCANSASSQMQQNMVADAHVHLSLLSAALWMKRCCGSHYTLLSAWWHSLPEGWAPSHCWMASAERLHPVQTPRYAFHCEPTALHTPQDLRRKAAVMLGSCYCYWIFLNNHCTIAVARLESVRMLTWNKLSFIHGNDIIMSNRIWHLHQAADCLCCHVNIYTWLTTEPGVTFQGFAVFCHGLGFGLTIAKQGCGGVSHNLT